MTRPDPYDNPYASGLCHVHALAAHRLHGGGFLLLTTPGDDFCTEDGEAIDNVVHVYSLHRTGTGEIARDVYGDRPVQDALAEAIDLFDIEDLQEVWLDNPEQLATWIDTKHDGSRPLLACEEDLIDRALRLESVTRPLEQPQDLPAPG